MAAIFHGMEYMSEIKFSNTSANIFKTVFKNRELISALAEREITAKYKGSYLGLIWAVLQPVMMLAVYTLVFTTVFHARWGGNQESKSDFAIALFAGLMVFNLFSECVGKAPGLVIQNPNYVTKVVFPLEILCIVNLVAGLVQYGISFVVWLIFYLVCGYKLNLVIVMLPIIACPVIMLTLGISWGIAAVGVYIKDLGQIVTFGLSVLLFITPILYPIDALNGAYKYIVGINPLTKCVEYIRNLTMFGKLPDIGDFAMLFVTTYMIMILGYALFDRLKEGFADVI